jgi:hypothetical protein
MRLSKVLRKRLRRQIGGVNVAADISAVVAGTVDEAGVTTTRSASRVHVVQRSPSADETTRESPDPNPDKEDRRA